MTRLTAAILRRRAEQAQQSRKAKLEMLARLMRFNTDYAAKAAGFWLSIWHGSRSVLLGTHRTAA